MSNDRELLELAAKAAGIELWHEDVFTNGLTQKVSDNGVLMWNPLLKDDDALRLAVTLYFTVQVDEEDAKTYVVSDGGLCVAIESHTTDPLVATRLAITRAAAEIGRNMK